MCPASYLRNMLKLKSWFVHVKRINFNLIQLNPIPRQLSITSPSSGSTEAANAKDIKEPIKEPKIENKYACNHPGLMEFFEEPKNWGEEEVKSGQIKFTTDGHCLMKCTHFYRSSMETRRIKVHSVYLLIVSKIYLSIE